VVNKYGKRFADETFFQGIVPQLRLFDPVRHEYPNLPAYLVFDTQYLKKYFLRQPADRQRCAEFCVARRELAGTGGEARHRSR
jgi:3-oxosteroid 1-dehydrogenase